MNEKLFKNALKLRFSGKTDEAIDIYNKIIAESDSYEEITRAKKELESISEAQKELEKTDSAYVEEKRIEKQALLEKDKLILSTCSVLEGYKVTEQLGLVSGEALVKLSLSDRLNATLDDLGASFTFKMTEMTGTMSLLEQAKEYSLDKMKIAAFKKGANAIIGIDIESSFGDRIMHITVNGTAVKVEKLVD